MKTVKINDFDWDGFRRSEFCIVSNSSQNLLAVLQALSAKGYYWGISGKSLIEDSVTKDQLLDDIKQELIYIRAGGLLHGVICDYTDRRCAVTIDFNEEDNMNMTEIKRVKVEDFDSEAFKRKKFRIVIRSPKSVPRTLKFLHEKGFKWGCSKTSLLEDAHMREQLLRSSQHNPVFIIAGGDIRNGVVRDIMSSSCIPAVELIFEETRNDKIVITNDGKTTTATLYSNGKKAGIGTVVCHDDDAFDVYAGARLALERLEKNKKETEMTDWEKFIDGKVNMRVPKKYIRNFLDRAEKDGVTFQGTMLDWYLIWLEQDGDSILICVNSKIKKIPVLVEVISDDNGKTVDYFPGMK